MVAAGCFLPVNPPDQPHFLEVDSNLNITADLM